MNAQTLHQRRAIRAYIEHGGHPDPMVRYELERAARDASRELAQRAHQPEPVLFCAPVEAERPLNLAEIIRINALGLLALACMFAIGCLLAPAVERLLVAAGVL
jgi:hypothetical protein